MPDARPWYVRYHLAPDLRKGKSEPLYGIIAHLGRFLFLTYVVIWALGFGFFLIGGILGNAPVTTVVGVVGLLFLAFLLRYRLKIKNGRAE